MSLAIDTIQKIENVIRECLRKKFKSYKPESSHMPFHYRLVGRDRMALFSFIQSLNTTFGTSIFEPVAEEIAKTNFVESQKQYVAGNEISEQAQIVIQRIIDELSSGKDPDIREEVIRIKEVCNQGQINKTKPVKVDLYVKKKDRTIFLFDLKTAKPNASNFKDLKRTLLEWVAIFLFRNPEATVYPCIAIPYNPYDPKPYERWTMKGMLDFNYELKVAEEFWDFLGGKGTYTDLLDCFERIGIELRPEIDKQFLKFQ